MEPPVPWNYDMDDRLRRHLNYITKTIGVAPHYYEVLAAAQYLSGEEVKNVLRHFEVHHEGIKDPTGWVLGRLDELTRMHLNLRIVPEEIKEKVKSQCYWLNRECEFITPVDFHAVWPIAYEVDYDTVSKILNRVHSLVHLVGNEEVRKNPTKYIRFALKRWKKDKHRFKKWKAWWEQYGDLKKELDVSVLYKHWKNYDRVKFWNVISKYEDQLPEVEDPTAFLEFKLLCPAMIYRVSQDYFEGDVDVPAVEEVMQGMTMEQVDEVLEDCVRRRWEVEDDPTGFIMAVVRERKAELEAEEAGLEGED